MNDVRESFNQAGAKTIGSYLKQKWVVQDTIDCGDVLIEELISQADLLRVVPKRRIHEVVFDLRA
ncbi:hypothetical protein SH467x_003416 [Pirellulaceae bacterium SH467]|jgi:hypothetical protein